MVANRPVSRCTPLLFLLLPVAAGASWERHTGLLWHDNATNADARGEVLPAAQTLVGLHYNRLAAATSPHRWRAGFHVQAEVWPRYDGLDQLHLGGEAEWTYKFGLGPYRPVLGAGLAAGFATARESARSGPGGRMWLLAEQRLAAHWRARLQHEISRHDARQLAFDRTAHESALTLHQAWRDRWSVELEVRHRHGDVVSYLPASHPALVDKSQTPFKVATFDRAEKLVAYYFDAVTRSGRVGLVHRFSSATRLALGWEHRLTRQGVVPYRNRIVSLEIRHAR
jgi:hypothetical protein